MERGHLMRKRMFGVAMLAAMIGLCAGPAAVAGGYYVVYGGAGGQTGGDWTNAFAEIQDALDAIQTSMDTAPVVYIGKTTGAQAYDGAQKTFTFDFTADVELKGGVTVGTTTQSGVSAIRDTGEAGLDLRQTGGSVGTPFNADFKMSNLDIKTDRQAVYGQTGNSNTITSYTVSNSTLSTTGPTYVTVQMGNANGIPMPELTVDNCTVTTAAGSGSAAIASHFSNYGGFSKLTVKDSTVTASADGSTTYKRGAIDTENRLFLDNATITNNGTGWGAIAGATSYINGHEVKNSTITSQGGGVELDCSDFSPAGVATKVEKSTITSAGASGVAVRLYGWHGTGNDGSVTDVLVSNSTLDATGTGGVGLEPVAYNGGVMDIDIKGSTISGVDRAFYLHGGGGNRGNDGIDVLNSTLSAGTNPNSSSEVMLVDSISHVTVNMDRTLVENGAGGINLDPGRSATLNLVNCAITDQELAVVGGGGYGIRLNAGDTHISHSASLTATNCTLSDLDGPAVLFDPAYGAISATLKYSALVPGVGGTVFQNNDASALTLNGDYNAFYEYTTFASGVVTNNLTNSLDFAAGSAGLGADGYHLASGSPLINAYPWQAGDPAVDIDGAPRPYLAGDIGADELPPPIPEPAGLGLVGLALLALRRRRS